MAIFHRITDITLKCTHTSVQVSLFTTCLLFYSTTGDTYRGFFSYFLNETISDTFLDNLPIF